MTFFLVCLIPIVWVCILMLIRLGILKNVVLPLRFMSIFVIIPSLAPPNIKMPFLGLVSKRSIGDS